MNDVIAGILLLIGASFLLLAGVGILRMPDVFSRMQAATKASTLGVACMLLAAAVHFNDAGITVRALATIVFFFLTAPVTAHLIGRASYFVGVPLWEGTVRDELRGQYNLQTHMLDSSFASTVPSPVMDAQSHGGTEQRGAAHVYDAPHDHHRPS